MEKEILENPVVKNGLAILSNINDELKYNNILNINNLLLKMSVILVKPIKYWLIIHQLIIMYLVIIPHMKYFYLLMNT